ncbi:MAG: hypothetical protein WAV41_03335 [Microgenomates group bacterium]
MTNDGILKKVLKNLGEIVVESGKEGIKEAGKMTETIVTGKQLLGDIKTYSPQEMAQRQAEDERKRQQEMADLRSQISGRNVEEEIKQVEKEREQTEDQKEKEFLEKVRQQREAEAAERNSLSGEVSANPAKRKKKRGGAFAKGKKKTQQPDPSQLSQTAEIAGKME